MERVTKTENNRRIKKLKQYIKSNGVLKVAAFCGYDDTAPVKMWIKRKSIPLYLWPQLKPLLAGEKNVQFTIK